MKKNVIEKIHARGQRDTKTPPNHLIFCMYQGIPLTEEGIGPDLRVHVKLCENQTHFHPKGTDSRRTSFSQKCPLPELLFKQETQLYESLSKQENEEMKN